MEEIPCGKVTEIERDEIKKLFQRKIALGELFVALSRVDGSASSHLYEKVVEDMGVTATAFHEWWNGTSKKYSWTSISGANWKIDFETCEVFLVKP